MKFYSLFITFWFITALSIHAQNKPNFLIVTADDMNYDSVGVNGCKVPNTTPHIDQLAREGMRFTQAHVASTACQPSRTAIQSGRIGHRSGGEGFHTLQLKNLPTIPRNLKNQGYLVGIIGKVKHSTPYEDTPWDLDIEVKRNTDQIIRLTKEFIERAESEGKPYYLIVNSHDPHRPYFKIDSALSTTKKKNGKSGDDLENSIPSHVFTPDGVHVPYDLPDTTEIRHELACYYSSVRRCDDVLGGIHALIKTEKREQNTLIGFLSDHDMAKYNAKSNTYPQSTRTPLILKMKGTIPTGVEESYVSSLDLFPTFLDLAEMPIPEGLDGQSLKQLFEGQRQHTRSELHTQFYANIGKTNYQMRCYQNPDFAFIYNAWHDGRPTYLCSALGGSGFKENDKSWSKRPKVD